MKQSRSRVSRVGDMAKAGVAALVALTGLTFVGVEQAGAVNPPAITSLTTTSGTANGGTSVQINGTGFGTTGSITSVTFGGVAATFTQASVIKITATSPFARTSTTPVDVRVTNGNGTSAIVVADQYTYT